MTLIAVLCFLTAGAVLAVMAARIGVLTITLRRKPDPRKDKP